MVILKNIAIRQAVHYPLNLSHMPIPLTLTLPLFLVKRILTQNVESQTVGNYHGAHHHLALLLSIVSFVERIVFAQILIQTDA